MSANDQVLSNEGGEEASVPIGTLPVDNTTTASTQEGDAQDVNDVGDLDGDAVDNGAGTSASVLADPSVPSVNRHPLTELPTELLWNITAEVGKIGWHSMRLSSQKLRKELDTPPIMSHREYVEFHKRLEAHSAHKLTHLLCPSCNTFKKPTPSRTTFTDAHAVQNYSGKRTCIECGIANGHYDKRDVVIKGKKFFVCGCCKLILAPEKEEKGVADIVTTKGYPYRDYGWGSGAEITIGSGGKRWCKGCRAAVAGLGDTGAIKLKQVRMP